MKDITSDIIIQSLKLKTCSVSIEGSKHTLTEITGAQRDTFVEKGTGRIKWEKGRASGFSSMKDQQADLLALALLDAGNQPVKLETLRSWPASVVGLLYKRAQALSGLKDDEEDEEEKKAEAKKD